VFVSSLSIALSKVASLGICGIVRGFSITFDESIGLYFLMPEALNFVYSLSFLISSSSFLASSSLFLWSIYSYSCSFSLSFWLNYSLDLLLIRECSFTSLGTVTKCSLERLWLCSETSSANLILNSLALNLTCCISCYLSCSINCWSFMRFSWPLLSVDRSKG